MSESNLVQLLVRCTRDERKAFRKMALELDTTVQEMVMSLCRDAHAAWIARQVAAKKQPDTVRSVEPEGTTRGEAYGSPRTGDIQPTRAISEIGREWFVIGLGVTPGSVGPFSSYTKAWRWLKTDGRTWTGEGHRT